MYKSLFFIAISLGLCSILTAQVTTTNDDYIKLIGVGDVNLGTAYPSAQYLPPNDNPLPFIEAAKPFLQGADIAFCNLEGPFTSLKTPYKQCKNPDICYIFRTPPSYFKTLVDLGFNLFSVANNHIFDFGPPGLKDTYALIDSFKLHTAGTLDRESAIFTKDGVTYGFCAFSPNRNVVHLNRPDEAKRIVSSLAEKCDVVIVSFHGGGEGKDRSHVTKQREFYIGEDRGNVYEFAKMVIDAGADVVLGHGPHVPRGVYLYKDRFIAFSMGNFCTYSRVSVSGISGYAPMIELKLKKDGQFVSGNIHSFTQAHRSGISYDPTNKVAHFVRDLSKQDFPDSKLSIADDGTITKQP